MKKLSILFVGFVTMLATGCANTTGKDSIEDSSDLVAGSDAVISFKEYEHDFGKVTEGEKVAYVFGFENQGTSDLVIRSALTTCGCTVPKYDKKPISPGKGGTLEVVFDTSGRSGMQTKTITVRSNASIPAVILKITADIVTNNN
jgi:hypothetical protein